jgi:hypothetical protein
MATPDPMILSRIGELVEQERQLRDRHRTRPLESLERLQLEDLETELDQCWDLLNQRRALREFGFDPEAAEVRDEGTVEGYQQKRPVQLVCRGPAASYIPSRCSR